MLDNFPHVRFLRWTLIETGNYRASMECMPFYSSFVSVAQSYIDWLYGMYICSLVI